MKKRIFSLLLVLVLCISLAVPAFAESDMPRLVDDADLLTQKEEREILSILDEVSERQKVDIVIVTVDSLYGERPRDYADDFYDYNGYGFGSSKDGILLLVSMEDRDWYISTTGYGIEAVTDAGREYMADRFADDLSDGNYAKAFQTVAEQCDDFIDRANAGKPYDVGNLPKGPFAVVKNLLISLVIGFVVALVATSIMRGKLKTVRFQAAAGSYVKPNSMDVTTSRDLFLYTHIDRRARPKQESSSGGGSSTHTSSSGTTHGGGGGKF